MLLYKYVRPRRIDVLTEGVIRFTQASEFNDPFDVAPHFAGVLQPFNEALVLAVAESYIGAEVTAKFKGWLNQRVAALKASFTQEVYSAGFGVLSLTENPTDLLMWAHYADCHRGLVFEFDSTHKFFHRFRQGTLGTIQKVTYAPSRPSVVLSDHIPSFGKSSDDYFRNVFLTKSTHWQYEKEWRLILPLDCPKTYPHSLSGRCHLFPLDRQAITGVILGARVSNRTAARVKAAITTIPELSHIKLRRVRISDSSYELVIDDFDAEKPPLS